MKLNNYFLKTVLMALSLTLIVSPATLAMQQADLLIRGYKSLKGLAATIPIAAPLVFSYTLILQAIIHSNPCSKSPSFCDEAPKVTAVATLSCPVVYYILSKAKKSQLQMFHQLLHSDPSSIAALKPEDLKIVVATLHPKQIDVLFEQAVRDNKPLLVEFLFPYLKNPNTLLAMFPLARAYKHDNVIKILAQEIKKHLTKQIDTDLYAIGINIPSEILKLISDYVAHPEPVVQQLASNESEEHEHQD